MSTVVRYFGVVPSDVGQNVLTDGILPSDHLEVSSGDSLSLTSYNDLWNDFYDYVSKHRSGCLKSQGDTK